MAEKKTVEVKTETWQRLMQEKIEHPDENFDEIINRALDSLSEQSEEEVETEPEQEPDVVEHEPEPEPAENQRGDVEDLLARVRDEIPGPDPKRDKRLEAMRAVLEHLQTVDYAETGELQDIAWSAESDTYARARSLWSNSILPGLRRLREDGIVEGGEEKQGGWWMDDLDG